MRIRINYKKELPLRFTSALDIQRIWERTFRRAGLKIYYSKGFHPQPKIQLGFPLPLGFISDDEIVDIWLDQENLPENLLSALQEKVPLGIQIEKINKVSQNDKPVITNISSSEYSVLFWDKDISPELISKRISTLIDKKEIIRTKRNGKKYDLRPLILDISNNSIDNQQQMFLKLVTKQDKMGRPDEVMNELGFNLSDFLIKKIRSY